MHIETRTEGTKLVLKIYEEFIHAYSIGIEEHLLQHVKGFSFLTLEIDLSECQNVPTEFLYALANFRMTEVLVKIPTKITGANLETRERMKTLQLEKIFDII